MQETLDEILNELMNIRGVLEDIYGTMPLFPSPKEEIIKEGIDQALGVYPSQVLNAITDGVREAIKESQNEQGSTEVLPHHEAHPR